jgi:hypothetical protein
MKINYLSSIWDVKIYLAKIKDCKGKDLYVIAKKSLPTKTRPLKENRSTFFTLR